MKTEHIKFRIAVRYGEHTMEERDRERIRSIKNIVLDLFEMGKTPIKIVWWISRDPDSQYLVTFLMLDVTVIDLIIDPA